MDVDARSYITRRPRFGPIDAQIVYPLLLWMLHIRMWSTIVLFIAIIFLWYLTKKGIHIGMMIRIIRRWFAGNRREIRSPWRKNMPL